jgi:GNAT superfamily N-acetyltransferase
MLRDLMAAGPGVAARRDGRLAGYVLWRPLAACLGQPAAYSPEWANGALPEDSARIYAAMYAAIAGEWVGGGRTCHLIGLLAHDADAIGAWHRLGFGMVAADAARDLSPVNAGDARVSIRRAGVDDQAACVSLDRALQRHLAAPPTCLYIEDAEAGAAQVLGGPAHAVWVAERAEKAVAYLRIGPATEDACTIIRDPGTASITGAYTLPEVRGAGVGSALLDRALAWAREEGYARCTVDYEPMNVPGARFWRRYFAPVVYALARHIDVRVL